ncbi:uncharacterized protein L203_104251 [Cryptococcus depauperatus CBS 7841]|uniref:Uncharacterized protein n=1 Tax=Cryptococcus depauperatus CBS 7841 TaxID=1295531 RepID=A0A1E3I7N6_9TREE|nr:hypothetical protein L203_05256 [Cryptococcus depauperatus CBS 7841]
MDSGSHPSDQQSNGQSCKGNSSLVGKLDFDRTCFGTGKPYTVQSKVEWTMNGDDFSVKQTWKDPENNTNWSEVELMNTADFTQKGETEGDISKAVKHWLNEQNDERRKNRKIPEAYR